MTWAIAADKLSKDFGRVKALCEVSFALPPGELVALAGPNGAGKTTLMKLILGLIRPSRGTVQILGEDPAACSLTTRRQLGYLPENVAFNDALTGRETLSFYARLKGESAKTSPGLLERVGLTTAAQRRVATYSKGMRQRLGLAQALLGNPRVLVLDEPTSGLDPAFRGRFYELIREFCDRGATVLLSSHALTELEERADRIIIMKEGIAVANAALGELRRATQLPSRIVLTLADAASADRAAELAQVPSMRRINPRVVEFLCPERDKLDLVRRLVVDGSNIANLEVVPPGLDELYAHFLGTQVEAR
jgi:Cu-processing system ATP-binding protein